jgi:Zn ribbon nucleic-acid-binding protein
MAVFQQKAYVAGCVCHECRVHQRLRMAKNRGHDQYDGRVYRTC